MNNQLTQQQIDDLQAQEHLFGMLEMDQEMEDQNQNNNDGWWSRNPKFKKFLIVELISLIIVILVSQLSNNRFVNKTVIPLFVALIMMVGYPIYFIWLYD